MQNSDENISQIVVVYFYYIIYLYWYCHIIYYLFEYLTNTSTNKYLNGYEYSKGIKYNQNENMTCSILSSNRGKSAESERGGFIHQSVSTAIVYDIQYGVSTPLIVVRH